MSNKLTMKERAAGIGMNIQVTRRDPDAAPKTMPGHSLMFRAQSSEMQDEIDRLKNEQGVKKVAISRLHKVAGRQRNLTAEEYADLRENLRNNALITPVTVCKRADGDWDIVAGNNRTDVYRELGRTEIEIFEIAASLEEANVSAFYSNLLHPSLPDFEKYLGFKRRMEETGKTQDQIAAESGIGKGVISKLMSFGRLPASAIEILTLHPTKLGSSAALELAQLVEQGKAERVLTAIKEIVFKDVSQSSAVAAAAKIETKATVKPEIQNLKIKAGKSTFAEIRGADSTLRISFKDEQKRVEFSAIIYDLLKKYADAET
jgi:ParB family chromosome partitioning protein